MRRPSFALCACWFWSAFGPLIASERINHEGRILGPEPVVTTPVLFNSPAADAIVAAMQIMPVDSAWNEDISARPLLANSAEMIARVKADLAANRQTLRPFYEMNYVLVPDNQPRLAIDFFNYADESDLDGGSGTIGTYPIPVNMPVETWPVGTPGLTLEEWQRDVNGAGGDRHSIVVMPGANAVWETWLTQLVGTNWEASNGAKFSLNSNTLRPAGWTSGDAAGLPMFPAVVRYDECQRGVVEHAMRLVVAKSRREYIYPATHYASSIAATAMQYPAMGQRMRLKASYPIPATWSKEEKAVLMALKKYGAIVADNGGFFSISVCPDDRFAANAFSHLSTVNIDNFEVIQTTAATSGPRTAGAPTVNGGADQTVQFPAVVGLGAAVNDPSGTASVQWTQYAGPGTVSFGNANLPVTTAAFTIPGVYTLVLSAADGLHAVAHDAVIVRVMPRSSVGRSGNDIVISFATATGQRYRVQQAITPSAAGWSTLADDIPGTSSNVAITDVGAASQEQRFYRVLQLP